MTHRLYYDNAYLTEFDACVQACERNGNYYDVLLEQSAFYPTSGGQPFDTGYLNDGRVVDVNVKEGQVWHTVTKAFSLGESVHGKIDWNRRFDHMQQHAGDHMIAGTLHRMLGGVTIGLHISDDVSTIDVAMPDGKMRITDEEVRAIEQSVNEEIQRNVPIRCWFPTENELKELPLRKKPTVNENIRIVAIGEHEMVACGGTHPLFAGEIGLVKILSVAPARGKMRVSFLAGQRALKDYFDCYKIAHSAAEAISANVNHLCAGIMHLQEKLRALETEVTVLKKNDLKNQILQLTEKAEILPNGIKLISGFVDTETQMLREVTSHLIENTGVIALLGTLNGENASYVFGCSDDVKIDMGKLLCSVARPLGGKGGGKPGFAQGGGSKEILEAARKILIE